MKLLGTDGSPYVRKVRITLEEKSVAYDYVRERPSVPGSSVPSYNPLAKIPTLVLDNGKAIYDSPVIVEYVDGIGTGAKLIPTEFEARIEVKRWEALGDGICDAGVACMGEKRRTANQSQDYIDRQLGKVKRGIAVAAKELGDKPWCHGGTHTLADIALGTALGYIAFRFPDYDWQTAYPNLKAFHERMMARPAFASTVPADH